MGLPFQQRWRFATTAEVCDVEARAERAKELGLPLLVGCDGEKAVDVEADELEVVVLIIRNLARVDRAVGIAPCMEQELAIARLLVALLEQPHPHSKQYWPIGGRLGRSLLGLVGQATSPKPGGKSLTGPSPIWRTNYHGSQQSRRVLVTVTFAWSFSLNRSSPGSSKRSSGALSATLTFEPGLSRKIQLAL